jgi:hypothetical protein
MQHHPHHDRTIRLLESRLEVLADVFERSLCDPRPLDFRVLAVEAATRHAIELELLSREEAGEIWAAVARRHPLARWCQAGPGLTA